MSDGLIIHITILTQDDSWESVFILGVNQKGSYREIFGILVMLSPYPNHWCDWLLNRTENCLVSNCIDWFPSLSGISWYWGLSLFVGYLNCHTDCISASVPMFLVRNPPSYSQERIHEWPTSNGRQVSKYLTCDSSNTQSFFCANLVCLSQNANLHTCSCQGMQERKCKFIQEHMLELLWGFEVLCTSNVLMLCDEKAYTDCCF